MGKKNQGGGNQQGGGGGGCTINPTTKWAVWDAPGVTQPPSTGTSTGKKPSSNNNNKANNNSRFFAASPSTTETTTSTGAGPAPSTAKLQCQCGEVVISLCYPPVRRVECCCCDCRKALQWLQEKAGNSGSTESLLKMDLIYFPNCFQVEQGGENLEVFMIKENYNTKRIVASCCQTALMGDHPSYQQQKIVTYNVPPSKLTLPRGVEESELMPPLKRIFDCDLTDAEKSTLGPFEKQEPTAAVSDSAAIDDLKKWKTKHPKYTTIQNLILSVGPLQYMDPSYDGKETEWNKQLGLSAASGV